MLVLGCQFSKSGEGNVAPSVHFLLSDLVFAPRRRGLNFVIKWSDFTRTEKAGQYHKNCATVEFSAACLRSKCG